MIPTQRRLQFASGYLALGLLVEASDELEAIAGEDRLSPEVMALRIDLYTAAKQWDLLLAVARELARQRPDHCEGWIGWAYALRELNRIAEALAVLREAEPRHGKKCAELHYNLACYHSLLGEQAEARQCLSVACKMNSEFKKTALDDPDLKSLWDDFASSP